MLSHTGGVTRADGCFPADKLTPLVFVVSAFVWVFFPLRFILLVLAGPAQDPLVFVVLVLTMVRFPFGFKQMVSKRPGGGVEHLTTAGDVFGALFPNAFGGIVSDLFEMFP